MESTVVAEKPVETLTSEELDKEFSESFNKAKDTGTPPAKEPEPVTSTKEEATKPVKEDEPEVDDGFKFDTEAYKAKGWKDEHIEELVKERKRTYHSQKQISKQSNEVGELRKKSQEISARELEVKLQLDLLKQNEEAARNNYEDPTAFVKNIEQSVTLKQQQADMVKQRQALETKSLVYSAAPDFESLIQSSIIEEVVKDDAKKFGWSDAIVNEITTNLRAGKWVEANPQEMLHLADKARILKRLKDAETKLSEISKSPDEFGKKLAKVANQRPQVNGSNAVVESEKDPYAMTAKEIEDELRAMNKL